MGRRTGPVLQSGSALDGARSRARMSVAWLFAVCALFAAAPAIAQTPPQRMVVEAKELIQDNVRNIVTARGSVQIYYKGRTLEADQVVYDRKTSRVIADGHARLTEENGTVSTAERFDLTDDLKQGFIDSLTSVTSDKTYISSPRAELAGDSRVFDRTTYTACKPCDEDPDRAPIWRIRSRKVIQRVDEQNLYFEDADLEFFGLPIAYLPFFSIPDPSVKRRSGFLSPHFTYKSQIGNGFGVPVFWAVAPNIDLTVTPTFFTRQGVLGEIDWKHRLDNGVYGVRLNGIAPANRTAFANPPFGASDRKFRGAVSSTGEFAINDRWKFGWDGAYLSDRYFLQDFGISDPLYNNYFFREISSTAYLTGKGDQSYFDLRAYAFQSLSPRDYQPQIGFILPQLEYNKVVPLPPSKSFGIGGQLEFDVNIMNSHADAALYDPIRPRTLDAIYGANYVCQFYTPGATPNSSQCLLRGIGGDYGRATGQASWQRRYIDPIGEAWTPFAYVRGNGSYVDYDKSRSYAVFNYLSQPLPNSAQSLFIGSDNVARANVLPAVGLDYRYPFFSKTPWGSMTFEPIAQFIARPDRGLGSNSLVNLDSQSLVFDDSTLFAWNKFSGYDRFETGTRLNYGGQATMNFEGGGFINVMGGQSVQVAGRNGFANADAANVGLSSGLDTRRSDYVGRFAIAPNSMFSFVAKGRFDVNTFSPRRIDLVAGLTLGPLVMTAQYANYASQPVIGFDVRRQGLSFGGKYDITSNYFVSANVTFDLSRHLYNNTLSAPALFLNPDTGQTFSVPTTGYTGTAPVFSIAGINVGAGYHDECTTFSVNYSSTYQANSLGQPARNQTIIVSLQLRTLAQGSFGASLGSTALNDGVLQRP